ncbi:MAG: 4Fe-4S dicluster domain-containing protein [Phycisphaerae bacterium]|nr:4Fe-4S dicluster domain-containing protein [Phycisphaerae bacterium]
MRITTIRIISQTFFFVLFVVLLAYCTLETIDRLPLLHDHLSKFLEVDPLVALTTAVTTRTVYRGLMWSLVVLIPTLLLGRVFCGWVCPFGALNHFTGWLFDHRKAKARMEANRYRPLYRLKYYILVAFVVALLGPLSMLILVVGGVLIVVAIRIAGLTAPKNAERRDRIAVALSTIFIAIALVAGIARWGYPEAGSLQIGLLDPICLVHRSMTVAVLPALNNTPIGVAWFGDARLHQIGWVIGMIFLGLLVMAPVIFRFFCRTLCPLGALLGVLSRFGLWRIERDRQACTDCGLCRAHCEGACDPDGELRVAECMVCFNCLDDCPHQAISFRFMPAREHHVVSPDMTRRGALVGAVAGAGAFAWMRLGGRSTKDFHATVIRPPGAVEEQEFLKRCLKCGQCIRVCPTNVLQPDWTESGVEGLWTPVLNYRIGYCEPNCTACGQVCPTGAIQRMTIEQKRGMGKYAEDGPVRLGSAHFDVGRCLPWAKNMPCLVCEENCPVSPKAIYTEKRLQVLRDAKKQVVSATENTVTLSEWPERASDKTHPCQLEPDALVPKTDQSWHIRVRRPDGTDETHLIRSNTADAVTIDGKFAAAPAAGAMAVLMTELGLPKVDLDRCIGCGICEQKCVVAGNKRAVYVMAVGETRSKTFLDEARNRSLRLQ